MKYFPPFNYHFSNINPLYDNSNSLEILPSNFLVFLLKTTFEAPLCCYFTSFVYFLSFRFTVLLDTTIKKSQQMSAVVNFEKKLCKCLELMVQYQITFKIKEGGN